MTSAALRQRVSESPAGMLHPGNALTYASLLVGLVSVASALWQHNSALAAAGIALAVVLDTFDGRFARRFKRTSRECEFGAQLDSLADAVNSGIVPMAVVTAMIRPAVLLSLAWIVAAFLYLAAVVTRLGYYNISHDDDSAFTGIPAPVAALIVATLLLFPLSAGWMAVAVAVCAQLMVSPLRIARPRGLGMALFVAWPVTVIIVALSS